MRTRQSVPLLLLLFALTAGLFTMHTFGHSGPQPTQMAMGHGSAAAVAVPPMADHAGATAAGGAVIGPGGPRQMPMDPTAVCMAVLCALALVITVLVLHGRLRPAADLLHAMASLVIAAGRGPPRTGVGLRLADLSVLRN